MAELPDNDQAESTDETSDAPKPRRPDPHSPATKAAAKKAAAAEAAAKAKAAAEKPANRPTAKKLDKAHDRPGDGRGGKSDSKVASRSGDPRKKAEAQATPARYTAPIPDSYRVSPWYIPVMMFGFLGVGMLVIFLNYIGWPFGDPSNLRLLIGLAAILAGIMVATRYQ